MARGEITTIARARADRVQADIYGLRPFPSASLDSASPRRTSEQDQVSAEAERELAASRRALGIARHMARVLAEGSSLPHSLRALLRIVVESLGLPAGAVLALDATHRTPTVVASYAFGSGTGPDDSRVSLPEDHGWVRLELASRVAALGAPLSDHVASDHRGASSASPRSPLAGRGVRTVLAVPIRRGGSVVGVVELDAGPLRCFGPFEVQLVETMAEHAAAAMESAALRQRLSERDRQVESLVKATIDAQEGERERICLDIHDGVAQTLAAVCQYQQLLENRSELQGAAVRPILVKTSSLIQRAIRETREVISALRPAVLDTDGLVATLRNDLASLRTQFGWEVNFEADAVRLPEPVETALYRIVHEAINNARKHSRTSRLDVSIRHNTRTGRVSATVRDYGVGFDPARLRAGVRGKRVGLLSMRRRADVLQGLCDIQSAPGLGTTVRVEVAVPSEAGAHSPSTAATVPSLSRLADQQAS